MKKIEWENIPQGEAGALQRSKTPTGWLVREVMDVLQNCPNNGRNTSGYEWRSSITFVPDPDHVWLKPEVRKADGIPAYANRIPNHG